ncbi:MAG: hypothetical protein J6386_19755 [Candidatus Synoicihabitans palmerolidicus]|nr:hypothetical protein [Candidatus Synoicihabitans palmerolidicus]
MVETSDTRSLFYEPKHSYTRALQRSIPSMQSKGTELYTIQGSHPICPSPSPGAVFPPVANSPPINAPPATHPF